MALYLPVRSHSDASAAAARREIFLFQDGIVLAATLRAFAAEADFTRLGTAPPLPEGSNGWRRVGLRSLTQAGWLEVLQQAGEERLFGWTEEGLAARSAAQIYVRLGDFLARFASSEPGCWRDPWTADTVSQFDALVLQCVQRWHLESNDLSLAARVRAHLHGALATPLLLAMHASGRIGPEDADLDGFSAAHGADALLRAMGWIESDRTWMPLGKAASAKVAKLGLTASYLPLLARLPELYGGWSAPEEIPGARE